MADLQGTDVLFRRWDAAPAPDPPKAVFLLVHGLGAHSARWGFCGDFFGARGCASYAVELRGFGRSPQRPAGRIEGPLLFLVPGIDHLVDERATRRIYEKVAAADKTILEYPEMFHALCIDADREKVFGDVLDWAAKRT